MSSDDPIEDQINELLNPVTSHSWQQKRIAGIKLIQCSRCKEEINELQVKKMGLDWYQEKFGSDCEGRIKNDPPQAREKDSKGRGTKSN